MHPHLAALALFGWYHQLSYWIIHHSNVLLERFGYIAVFGLLFSCGLGVPVPEDLPLLFCGLRIARGLMSFWVAAPVCWLGIISGDCALYTLGFKLGPRVTKLPVIGSHINAKRLKTVERFFDRWGIWAVGLCRMFAGVRGAMVVVAGTTKFNFGKFIVADGLAAIVSGGAFMYLGYTAGRVRNFWEHRDILLAVCAVIVAAIIVWLWLRSRTKPPGPGDMAVEAAHHPTPPVVPGRGVAEPR